jgi:predicted dehydrogenase
MSRVYTVAVVGGGIGKSHIVEGYETNKDRFKVIAICDLDPTRRNALADEFGIERRVENFDDLLAMDDLDIIDVCTPPMVHYPGDGGAESRQARHLREAAGRFARRSR